MFAYIIVSVAANSQMGWIQYGTCYGEPHCATYVYTRPGEQVILQNNEGTISISM